MGLQQDPAEFSSLHYGHTPCYRVRKDQALAESGANIEGTWQGLPQQGVGHVETEERSEWGGPALSVQWRRLQAQRTVVAQRRDRPALADKAMLPSRGSVEDDGGGEDGGGGGGQQSPGAWGGATRGPAVTQLRVAALVEDVADVDLVAQR